MKFPVSIKGVLVEAGRVVLLENERDEWELSGRRPNPAKPPETCLVREFAEELGSTVEVAHIIDCWVYEVLPEREVVIITFGVKRRDEGELRISDEHRRFGFFMASTARSALVDSEQTCDISERLHTEVIRFGNCSGSNCIRNGIAAAS